MPVFLLLVTLGTLALQLWKLLNTGKLSPEMRGRAAKVLGMFRNCVSVGHAKGIDPEEVNPETYSPSTMTSTEEGEGASALPTNVPDLKREVNGLLAQAQHAPIGRESKAVLHAFEKYLEDAPDDVWQKILINLDS